MYGSPIDNPSQATFSRHASLARSQDTHLDRSPLHARDRRAAPRDPRSACRPGDPHLLLAIINRAIVTSTTPAAETPLTGRERGAHPNAVLLPLRRCALDDDGLLLLHGLLTTTEPAWRRTISVLTFRYLRQTAHLGLL